MYEANRSRIPAFYIQLFQYVIKTNFLSLFTFRQRNEFVLKNTLKLFYKIQWILKRILREIKIITEVKRGSSIALKLHSAL